MINQERLINQFMELVKIDSESGNEREIADFLKKKITELGLEVTEDNSIKKTGHGAGNLIASLKATENKGETIYFTSHMDTVTPGNGIKPSIDGGYIVSDGTTILGSDDKAGIAAMLEAITVIKEDGLSHGNIQFLITVGEESGLKGSRHLQEGLLQADYGYALDSNGPVGHIIIAAPTQAKITVTVYGKSAHAGVNPENGISAIQVASHAISKMKLGRIDHETTANIGKFQGGSATNIVSDRVDILAEARSLVNEKLEKQIQHMKEAFEQTADQFSTKVDFTSEIMYPAFRFGEDHQVVKKAIEAIHEIGRTPKLLSSGGGSDANVINGLGIPTINLGIGYENIHTTSEKMPISELVKTTELILALIKKN
ncbi:M20/M25/M40 family metallo-hydrolase [Tepidibacillus decaturensis]|uniref:Peptidase M20 dimerisation domain-containing protein n=1 Tax=Tepidibacillus decaturensis TaxID=1413211 RepID=A0A135L2T2_9BACI|nr:M20/M25/M40 family metallo-hydrolase [Tepidibacillus decaturensis]KXG43334.1 hypothetical protein U473_04365 [Tepidibacillus decaturensis]